jgi:hypothetical protein
MGCKQSKDTTILIVIDGSKLLEMIDNALSDLEDNENLDDTCLKDLLITGIVLKITGNDKELARDSFNKLKNIK